ncbi:MAG: hypothetical protein R3D82_12630 [Xanthobacteraceae bacterium]
MVSKRRRAKGGGRKAAGPFTDLTSPFSVRMPKSLREELERVAQASGKNPSQELLVRLSRTFSEDREKAREPDIRALCFLVAEAARSVGLPVADQLRSTKSLSWRNNPFFFRAFKIAVCQLLDALEPKGAIEAPEIKWRVKPTSQQANTGALDDLINSFETPEARGRYAAGYILNSLHTIPHLSPEERAQEIERLREISSPAFSREFYGMADAARDLRINDQEKKA